MRKFKPLIPNESDLKNPTCKGFVSIPKSGITKSNDPEALRLYISEEYTRVVQAYPHLNFGILVDNVTDEIQISWAPVKE